MDQNKLSADEKAKKACIANFTKKLKEDMRKEKMSQFKFEEGKFYTNDMSFNSVFKVEDGVLFEIDINNKDLGWKSITIHCPQLRAIGNFQSIEFTKNQKGFREVANPKSMKEVGFEKAIAGMREGKFYKAKKDENCEDFCIMTIKNDVFSWYSSIMKRWLHDCVEEKVFFSEFINLNFLEVSDPEKKEAVKISKYNEIGLTQDFKGYTEGIFQLNLFGNECSIGFDCQEKFKKFLNAFSTFMKLKSHPLAKIPVNDNDQYYIAFGNGKIFINWYFCNAFKFEKISPAFYSKEDVEKAISDLGEDNLIQMFKTFSGIYE